MTETRRSQIYSFVPIFVTIGLQTLALAWYLGKMSNQLDTIGKSLEGKASIESVSSIDTRLTRTERKVDRLDRTVAAHTGQVASVGPSDGGP